MHFDPLDQKAYFIAQNPDPSHTVDSFRINPDRTGLEFVLSDPGLLNYVEVLHTSRTTVPDASSTASVRCGGVIKTR